MPMKRLIEKTVFSGLVIAWRRATWPTSRSPSLAKATDRGRGASAFGVGDDGGLAALHDGHHRVGGAQVDADDLAHGVPWGLVSVDWTGRWIRWPGRKGRAGAARLEWVGVGHLGRVETMSSDSAVLQRPTGCHFGRCGGPASQTVLRLPDGPPPVKFRAAMLLPFEALSDLAPQAVTGVAETLSRLRGVLGLAFLAACAWALSLDRRRIPWRVVLWGMALQLVFAVLILRTPFGAGVFDAANTVILAVVGFTVDGAGFLFGDLVWNNVPVGTGDARQRETSRQRGGRWREPARSSPSTCSRRSSSSLR